MTPTAAVTALLGLLCTTHADPLVYLTHKKLCGNDTSQSTQCNVKAFHVVFNKLQLTLLGEVHNVSCLVMLQSDWSGADMICREYIPGCSSLACITSKEEQDSLDNYLNSLQIPPDVAFWVGGFKLKDKFRWVETARPLNYTNWADNQPVNDGNCITVQRQADSGTFKWIKDYCSHTNWILCQNFNKLNLTAS